MRYWLVGHRVETAYERGWAELANGDLLRMAEEAGFDVMITTDRGIRYQQNLPAHKLAIVVINTNNWMRIRKWKPLVVAAISDIPPGTFLEVEIPFP